MAMTGIRQGACSPRRNRPCSLILFMFAPQYYTLNYIGRSKNLPQHFISRSRLPTWQRTRNAFLQHLQQLNHHNGGNRYAVQPRLRQHQKLGRLGLRSRSCEKESRSRLSSAAHFFAASSRGGTLGLLFSVAPSGHQQIISPCIGPSETAQSCAYIRRAMPDCIAFVPCRPPAKRRELGA
jgi:hypothetical protein